MNRKKKELPILENIEISGIAAEGKAIAKVNELVIFVPFVVPGDIVDLQLTRKKNKYAEAIAIRFQKLSEKRAVPFCKHFGICGGCKWQILPYEEQLKFKQQQIKDNLERIGKIPLPEISPILGSEKTQFYRNKLEFTFSHKRWLTKEELEKNVIYEDRNALGFHIPGSFDKILDIEECWLQNNISNNIRNGIRQYAIEHKYGFDDIKAQNGLLRNIIIRTSSTDELMVIAIARVANAKDMEQLKDVLNYISTTFTEITSLIYIINNKCNDSIADLETITYSGKDHIIEKMGDLQFKVGPKSFYQTNSEQAYNLYAIVKKFAALKGEDIVYDLYTGTGTIANFIAKDAAKVIGIEYIEEAIADAKVNSTLNKIDNTLFYAGDMKDILNQDFILKNGHPDVIITDPPRAGMHPDVITNILLANPNRIVYVSCNPATQARDLQLLSEMYKVISVQPVDMFPHTQHVENVVLLEKK